jgi:hypothetical protein
MVIQASRNRKDKFGVLYRNVKLYWFTFFMGIFSGAVFIYWSYEVMPYNFRIWLTIGSIIILLTGFGFVDLLISVAAESLLLEAVLMFILSFIIGASGFTFLYWLRAYGPAMIKWFLEYVTSSDWNPR